jgi:hypothetical protein
MERKSTLLTWEKPRGKLEGGGRKGGRGEVGGLEGGGRGGEFNLARRNFSSLTNFHLGVI